MRCHLFVSAPLMRLLLFVLSVVASFADLALIGKIDAARPHQLGQRRLRVGVGAHDPDVGFRFENRSAARSGLRDLLAHLVRLVQFRIRQGVDLDRPFHCVLGLRVGHVGHRAHRGRCRVLRHHHAIDVLKLGGDGRHVAQHCARAAVTRGSATAAAWRSKRSRRNMLLTLAELAFKLHHRALGLVDRRSGYITCCSYFATLCSYWLIVLSGAAM